MKKTFISIIIVFSVIFSSFPCFSSVTGSDAEWIDNVFWDTEYDDVYNIELQETEKCLVQKTTCHWDNVEGASSFTLVLWKEYMKKYVTEEEEYYAPAFDYVKTYTDIKDNSFDFADDIKKNGDARYYFTVTSNLDTPPSESEKDEVWEYFQNLICDIYENEFAYYNRMSAPKNVHWENSVACWDEKDCFSSGDTDLYYIKVYEYTSDNKYDFSVGVTSKPGICKVDLSTVLKRGKTYVFTVSACAGENAENWGYSNGVESDYSDIYKLQDEKYDNVTDRTDWVAIDSAKDFVELANVEDIREDSNDYTTSDQYKEWHKKYYLTSDIDFSELSPTDASKTKSIGNIDFNFEGIFDGNGYEFLNLTLSNGDCGLFNYIGSSGVLYNIKVRDAKAVFTDQAGIIAYSNYGIIDSCGVINSNISTDNASVLGGLLSHNRGTVKNSYVDGGCLVSESTSSTGYGGFVGANESGGIISECWSSMDIDIKGEYGGGFVGLGYGSTGTLYRTAKITDCFALGNVSGRSFCGGFAGRSVYDDNVYENCYAFGTVSTFGKGVLENTGHGFIGGNGYISGDENYPSFFQYDQSKGVINCYYNSVNIQPDYDTVIDALPVSKEQLSGDDILGLLNKNDCWKVDNQKNDGLPFLSNTAVPVWKNDVSVETNIKIYIYDKSLYKYNQVGNVIDVTVSKKGNVTVADVMESAKEQGLIDYSYEKTSYGRFISEINGYKAISPDGWMFTVNDEISNLGTSVSTVKDKDKILWYLGTAENHFLPPKWDKDKSEDYIEIKNADELVALSLSDDDTILSKNYKLTSNIDLSNISFEGIGSLSHPFTGIFDGLGHTVSNLKIDGKDNTGFFNVISGATIKNLKIINACVTGNKNTGILVGLSDVYISSESSLKNRANTVGNCYVSGTVNAEESVGGLVGKNNGKYDKNTGYSIYSSVSNSNSDVYVSGSYKVGGLVGENIGYISNSYSKGTVLGDNTITGGFVGDNVGNIYSSYSKSNVFGNTNVGGFAGYSDGLVKDCYCTGNVSGKDYLGGFAGSISNADTVISTGNVNVSGEINYAGGFCGNLFGVLSGTQNQITVKNAYSNCINIYKAIGNKSNFQSDSDILAVSSMTLKEEEELNKKLYDLFGVNLSSFKTDEIKEKTKKIMDNIAEKYCDSSDLWTVFDMSLYNKVCPESNFKTDADAKQKAINEMIEISQSKDSSVSDYAKAEIVLRSVGADSNRLYTYNSNKEQSNALKLKNSDLTSNGFYPIPWILLADMQGNVNLSDDKISTFIEILKDNLSNMYGYTWEGITYPDIDTSATVLCAVSEYYDKSDNAKYIVDTIIENLTDYIQNSGTFGSANTDAMVIIGLLSLNINPYDFKSDDGNSVVEGLLSYYDDNEKMFTYLNSPNELATEQAFRAIIALNSYDFKNPLNIYDFSDNEVLPVRENKVSSGSGTTEPEYGEKTITVSFTMKANSSGWIPKTKITLPENSTVKDVFLKAVNNFGLKQVGAENGYVKSVTKGNKTLGEFTNGKNSGWLYKVNGKAPNMSMNDYVLKDSDDVLWYYTTDWTNDSSVVINKNNENKDDNDNAKDESKENTEENIDYIFVDIDSHWAKKYIEFVFNNNIMKGEEKNKFLPDNFLSRAMLVTIMYRIENEPKTEIKNQFTDLENKSWYYDAVLWAYENNIVNGVGNGMFLPDKNITREEAVVIFMRYVKYKEYVSSVKEHCEFQDIDDVSDWAKESVNYLSSFDIINGDENNMFCPKSFMTRGETAAIIVRFINNFINLN